MELKKSNLEIIDPNPIIFEALNYINENRMFKDKIAKVLDIGAGDGTDSIFLAKNGFNVTAIDSSSYYIYKINQLSKIHNIKIKSIKSDAITSLFKNYDIIVCNNILHLLKSKEAIELIKKMKIYTSVEGMNIVSLYINNDSPLNNLESFYTNWKIIHLNKSFHKVKKNKILLEFIALKI